MTEEKSEYRIDGRPKTIFRVAKNRDNPYVMIDKRPLENPSLSWKAKGLLAYLLSRPDNWEIIMGDLIKRSTDGESAVRSAIKELSFAGHIQYVGRERLSGKVRRAIWEIYEVPIPDSENRYQVSPNSEKPNQEKPNQENRPLNNNDSNNNESTKYDRKKGREEALQRKAERKGKSKDYLDFLLDQNTEEIEAIKAMRLRIETALNKNLEHYWDTEHSDWNGYDKNLLKREMETGQTIEKFMTWFNSDDFRRNNQRIWLKPAKIDELWREAFDGNHSINAPTPQQNKEGFYA